MISQEGIFKYDYCEEETLPSKVSVYLNFVMGFDNLITMKLLESKNGQQEVVMIK